MQPSAGDRGTEHELQERRVHGYEELYQAAFGHASQDTPGQALQIMTTASDTLVSAIDHCRLAACPLAAATMAIMCMA